MSVTNLLISASAGSVSILEKSPGRPGPQTSANRKRADEQQMREIIKLGREMLRRKRCAELAFDLVGIDGISLPIVPAPWTHQDH